MSSKKTLVLGASPNPLRFSHKAVKSLLRHDVPVLPVGIRSGKIGDVDIVKGHPAVGNIHTVTLYIGPPRQKEYYSYLLSLNPKRVIFNPGTENPEFMEMLKKEHIEVIDDCTLIMLNSGRY